ncbi:hypothetical protein PT273_06065 [Orbaceae bacterium ESL0727]|nr:hypothetical protein [Orbaceae bacterium ESL0727]
MAGEQVCKLLGELLCTMVYKMVGKLVCKLACKLACQQDEFANQKDYHQCDFATCQVTGMINENKLSCIENRQ